MDERAPSKEKPAALKPRFSACYFYRFTSLSACQSLTSPLWVARLENAHGALQMPWVAEVGRSFRDRQTQTCKTVVSDCGPSWRSLHFWT